jgi:FkbM family methyltransferase
MSGTNSDRAGTDNRGDPLWREVYDFCAGNKLPPARIIRPQEMESVLHGCHDYADTYRLSPSAIDWLIIHKGWIEQIDASFLRTAGRELHIHLANSVFVVYGRRKPAEPVDSVHTQAVEAAIANMAGGVEDDADDQPVASVTPFQLPVGKKRVLCRDSGARKIFIPEQDQDAGRFMAFHPDPIGHLYGDLDGHLGGAMAVLDIGAGLGLFAMACFEANRRRNFICCHEPQKQLAAMLRITLELNGLGLSTKVIEKAVCASKWARLPEAKSCSWHYRAAAAAKPPVRRWWQRRQKPDPCLVRAVPLEQLAGAAGRSSLDLVHIDVAGAEMEVLSTLEGFARQSPETRFLVRIDPQSGADADAVRAVYDQFVALGYKGAIARPGGGVEAFSAPELAAGKASYMVFRSGAK